MITVAHEIDCSDRVEIGDYSGLAGFRCTILTHSLNLVRDRFATGAVEIGHHTAVMSGSTLLSGTRVPARCVVSANSVVNTPLTEELTFYSGNPAEAGPHPARDPRVLPPWRGGQRRPHSVRRVEDVGRTRAPEASGSLATSVFRP